MCRILAYLGEPFSPALPVLEAEHSLLVQSYRPREMLSGTANADGFGVVWYHEGRPVRIAGDRPIWQASDLPALLRSVRTPAALAVVRSATPGIPVAGGRQPMTAGRHAFAFNGAVDDFRARLMRRLHHALPDEVYATLGGVSDTEALFRLAVARLRGGDGGAEALGSATAQVAREARSAGVRARLTSVLCDGDSLVGVRYATGGGANTLYLAERPPSAPLGTVLSSEPLDGGASWQEVPAGSVVRVTEDGVRISPFDPDP